MGTRVTVFLGILFMTAGSAWAQALPTAATIESIPLELTMPENYQVTSALEPVRRVALVAPADGVVRGLEVPLGGAVRPTQEIAQLDRAEASAWVKMALAEVKEKQAQIKDATGNPNLPVFQAQLEAAEAKAELAQLALDRLTLRAPFAGRITAFPVSSGQYVLKGTVIAELADVTGLKSLVPVDRRTAAEGRELKIYVEEQEQTAKVQSILPLPEAYAHLHELAAPFAAAWITVQNNKGELAPGLRVRSATLPVTPIATIPREAVKAAEASKGSGGAIAQVLRNEYVTNVPVEVLGKVGPERVQVTGAFRPTDALIVSASVPLLPGTLVRFSQSPSRSVEGTTPNPATRGEEAGITPPGRAPTGVPTTGAAPTRPAAAPGSRPSTRRPTAPTPAAGQGQGTPPPF